MVLYQVHDLKSDISILHLNAHLCVLAVTDTIVCSINITSSILNIFIIEYLKNITHRIIKSDLNMKKIIMVWKKTEPKGPVLVAQPDPEMEIPILDLNDDIWKSSDFEIGSDTDSSNSSF